MTARLLRGWRVAAGDYAEPAEDTPTSARINVAAAAERQLRADLAAGRVPDRVVLVAPQQATRADAGLGGTVRGACAWLTPTGAVTPASAFGRQFMGDLAPHCASIIEADEVAPDPNA